jgi:hypothetical protein
MKNMDVIYLPIGGLVFTIAWFRMDLLIHEKSFRLILGVSVALFFIGLILHFTNATRYSASGALLTPLLSLVLFRLCRKTFLRLYKHEPRDTLLNWEPGLGADRLFNIVYFVLALFLFILVPHGMKHLAKVGW